MQIMLFLYIFWPDKSCIIIKSPLLGPEDNEPARLADGGCEPNLFRLRHLYGGGD